MCDVIKLDNWRSDEKIQSLKNKHLRHFLSFNKDQIIDACIMAGCDYLNSIKNVIYKFYYY